MPRGVADGSGVEEEVFQRGEGGEGGFGRGEAFNAEPADVRLRGEVGLAAVADVEVQGGKGPGVREEELDGGGGLEVVVAAVWGRGRGLEVSYDRSDGELRRSARVGQDWLTSIDGLPEVGQGCSSFVEKGIESRGPA